ncbi:MAG: hypothetical protein JSS09_05345 [Verrucomicrobia bacterium]|nr:hypothetical protein [Verrucomicrobiota bacterium]
MHISNYVTLVLTVPETHADLLREVMGKAGAGKMGCYTHCSFSSKGVGRFKPDANANPYIGKEGQLEEVIEECIQSVCSLDVLEHVIEEVKKAHPYEETVIDIFPVYQMGIKQKTPLLEGMEINKP